MVKDTKQIGETSEAKVVAELKSLGYTVLTPFGDNEKYDLVYDSGNEFIRVQVKTGRLKDNGAIKFRLRTAGHNNTEGTYRKSYSQDEIDKFAVYCPDNNKCYLVDIEDTPETKMSLRVEPPNNGQTKGINMAKEFNFTERLK
jgi:hypothetical protein